MMTRIMTNDDYEDNVDDDDDDEEKDNDLREFKQGRRQRQRQHEKTMIWLVEWWKIIVLHVRHAL